MSVVFFFFFFFQAEDGIRDVAVTGVQTCALPIWRRRNPAARGGRRCHRGTRSRDGARRPPRPAAPRARALNRAVRRGRRRPPPGTAGRPFRPPGRWGRGRGPGPPAPPRRRLAPPPPAPP